jgi:hypothetical protein
MDSKALRERVHEAFAINDEMTKILTGVDWWWGKFAPRQFREKTEDLIVVRIQPSSGTAVVKSLYGGPTTNFSSTLKESFGICPWGAVRNDREAGHGVSRGCDRIARLG